MAERIDTLQDLATDLSMGTAQLPGRDVLDRAALRTLNVRSDWRGAVHFLSHCLTILVTGGLVHALRGELVLLVPAMILHGFAIVTLFAPMHECVHMTAFRSRWLNKVIGWAAGAATGLNLSHKLSFALSWGPRQRGGPPWHTSPRDPVPMPSFGIARRSRCQRWQRWNNG